MFLPGSGNGRVDSGSDSLVVFAPENFMQAAAAGNVGPALGARLRGRFVTAVLETLAENVFPGIREHIEVIEVLTPWVIREETDAELGAAYGRRPNAVNLSHANTETHYADNLHLANATVGLPSIGTAFQTASLLVQRLVGHSLSSETPWDEAFQRFGYGLLRDMAAAVTDP